MFRRRPPEPDDTEGFAARVLDMVRDGDAALLQYVDDGVPVELVDADGNNLVMLAAMHGQADLVRQLAARGGDVDRCNARGQSPLSCAVYKRHPDVVAALLDVGADPDLGSPTAHDTATMFPDETIQDLLSGRL